ncbi:ATP-binding protein [Rhodohalobacter sp.]|uniref:ATP-binding protein n=1 Tax=Rhodohalobacter sp. TaxID=1974210 RepID=UPI002ACE85CB|nr:ATP-binding protein [Rhodohalobacter sp.]MDZ7755066.1 ATP-binding protein [Rhodohalobacter sp.]
MMNKRIFKETIWSQGKSIFWAYTVATLALIFSGEKSFSQTADQSEKGTYIHRQYMTSEYNGHTQSWAVTEDDNGLIYIGNGNGLLEYDGVEWKMIEVAGGQVALSLALGKNNKLYVGSVNDFGVIEADSLGRSVFSSMVQEVPDELADFEDVWETVAYSEGVLFRTRRAAFHYSYNDSLTVLYPDERFERIHEVDDEIYIVDLGVGLNVLENMELQLVPGGSRFADISIWYMGRRPDGSIFIATREGTFLFDGISIEPYETQIAPILTDQNVYQATEIEGLGYAFATIRGGVYLTNYSGEILDVLDSRVLTSTQTTFVYADRFNNLWVTTTNGFNRVEISNPLSYFDESRGLSTGIVDLTRHDGNLYAISGSDIQYLKKSQSLTELPVFQTIPSSSVSHLSILSTDYGLLATSNTGLIEVFEDSTSQILPEFEALVVSQSLLKSDRVLLGHIDGVEIFEYLNGNWKHSMSIDGVSEQVNTVIQDRTGVIWAGTDFQGLLRIDPGDNMRVDRIDSEQFFDSGSADVYSAKGEVVISTETGIYKPSDPWDLDAPFIPKISDLRDQNRQLFGTNQVYGGVDDGYWVVTDATLGFTPSLENPLDSLHQGALARISDAIVKQIYPDRDGVVWVANENGIVRYNSHSDYLDDISFNAFVRRVTQQDELFFDGAINASIDKVRLPHEQNDMRFRFGTNFIEDEARTWYQVRMAGFDDDWTNWTRESFKDYTNIPHGDYVLEVRAMNTYGKISSVGTYAFAVLPPWWFSWWAYIGYLLIFAGGVFAIDRFQRGRLIKKERERAREKELEQAKEIEKAYQDLKAAKDQLVQQEKLASLGQLTAGIAHEIKNPLNFVNNFSELSLELVEEVRDEVRRVTEDRGPGDPPLLRGESGGEAEARGVSGKTEDGDQLQNSEEASNSNNTPLNPLSRGDFLLDILNDIESNLKTIHKHGTRADSIVKSMLQHSRGGDGKMEPTPLNPIIKEYVNLAFHGMRAGKEPINVDIDLQLDEKVGEVPLVAEDFSRVILNLVNNAFDAMRTLSAERSAHGESYHPKLTVRTQKTETTVTFEIEDNGPGIPDEMKDKILQPFFTTKKGTAGTGLGLSITNDIIKAHGGSLDVHSQPGLTTFLIKLTG